METPLAAGRATPVLSTGIVTVNDSALDEVLAHAFSVTTKLPLKKVLPTWVLESSTLLPGNGDVIDDGTPQSMLAAKAVFMPDTIKINSMVLASHVNRYLNWRMAIASKENGEVWKGVVMGY